MQRGPGAGFSSATSKLSVRAAQPRMALPSPPQLSRAGGSRLRPCPALSALLHRGAFLAGAPPDPPARRQERSRSRHARLRGCPSRAPPAAAPRRPHLRHGHGDARLPTRTRVAGGPQRPPSPGSVGVCALPAWPRPQEAGPASLRAPPPRASSPLWKGRHRPLGLPRPRRPESCAAAPPCGCSGNCTAWPPRKALPSLEVTSDKDTHALNSPISLRISYHPSSFTDGETEAQVA